MKVTDLINKLRDEYKLRVTEAVTDVMRERLFFVNTTQENAQSLFNYWSEDYENKTFGVDNKFHEMLDSYGYYVEWANPELLIITK